MGYYIRALLAASSDVIIKKHLFLYPKNTYREDKKVSIKMNLNFILY